MQLVAYGAQDIYLTGNPQITFFKVVYRRHTNFSMETIEQTISGSQTASTTGTVTISRNGDLVYKVYVTCAMTAGEDGNTLIDNVEVEIGGQRIDKQTTEWNQIWGDLSTPASKADGFKCMTGACGNSNVNVVGEVHVPLNFWFCRNPGLALPLIALQYHEVKLKCAWGAAAGTRKVLCDYIYLDTDERRRFAQVSHEYLIEQVQEQSCSGEDSNKLNFNHPVKELIWTSVATNAYGTALLKLNGHDRFSAQQEEYFQLRQPYDYHTSVPGQNIVLTDRPQSLAQPELVLATAKVHASSAAADDSFVVVAHATTDNLLIQMAAAPVVSVGDILLIHYPTTADAESESIVVKVTAVPATFALSTADQAFSILACGTAAPTTGVAPTVSAAGNGTIYKIASVQDPKSKTGSLTKKLNCYSFALKPEEHQPSGTCNFSRIDNAQLNTTGTALTVAENIYAVNYNVLRIMSGMGGLAYSN